MQNIKRFMLAFTMALLVAGCQVTIPPANNQGVNNSGTNATTLTILVVLMMLIIQVAHLLLMETLVVETLDNTFGLKPTQVQN